MQAIQNYFLHPSQLGIAITKKLVNILPDKLYLSLLYRFFFGRKLHWENPKAFTEKLQWLKLNDKRPEYAIMADKNLVKQYIINKIGADYVIPLLGVYKSFDEINFELLPNKFVLKTNHVGGGTGVVIVEDKNSFDHDKARKQLTNSLSSKKNNWKESQYDAIDRVIIAEQYLEHEGELNDYKFFCFNGVVKCFKIDFGRFTEHHANYYDRECNLLPFGESLLMPDPKHQISFPHNIGEMISIAEKLSKDMPFARIDLYNVNNHIYFGEITLHPGSGLVPYSPDEWDFKLGEWLNLNE